MASPTTLQLGETVNVKFLGWPEGHPSLGQPLRLKWNSREVVIQQGQTAPVLFDAVKRYFGDPRATDKPQVLHDEYGQHCQIPDRYSEIALLQQLWLSSDFGTNQVKFREIVPDDRTQFAGGISDRIPRVEVYTLAGERIYTVVDDPYGERVIEATLTRSDAQYQQDLNLKLAEKIDRMEKELEMLRARGAGNPGSPEDLGPDLPIGKPSPAFAEPSMVAPQTVVEESPRMVANPRTGRISRKKDHIPTPATVEDLPSDL